MVITSTSQPEHRHSEYQFVSSPTLCPFLLVADSYPDPMTSVADTIGPTSTFRAPLPSLYQCKTRALGSLSSLTSTTTRSVRSLRLQRVSPSLDSYPLSQITLVLFANGDGQCHYPGDVAQRLILPPSSRLEKNFTPELAKELQDRFPLFREPKELEAFRRKWLYMFAYAEVGFARGYTTLPCWTFTRPVRDPVNSYPKPAPNCALWI